MRLLPSKIEGVDWSFYTRRERFAFNLLCMLQHWANGLLTWVDHEVTWADQYFDVLDARSTNRMYWAVLRKPVGHIWVPPKDGEA